MEPGLQVGILVRPGEEREKGGPNPGEKKMHVVVHQLVLHQGDQDPHDCRRPVHDRQGQLRPDRQVRHADGHMGRREPRDLLQGLQKYTVSLIS